MVSPAACIARATSPPAVQLSDVHDRARAAFLGLAVGDALGATLEFMTRSEIRSTYGVHKEITGGGWLRLRRGAVTDDTEMSLCVARSIVSAGELSPREIAESFASWLRSNPCDVGNTCRRGIRRFMLEGSLEAPARDGDAGNGAAMRMVPVALFTLADGTLLDRQTLAQAHLTHNHPLSDAACMLFGRFVQIGCLGLSRSRLRRVADGVVERFPSFRFQPYRGLSTAYVVDTIATVLHFFFTTRSFEECLIAVVNQGGDSDTTGAMAGAVAGAYYGLEEIPARWWKRLDPALVREITRLADALVDLSPLGQGAPPVLT